MGSDRKRLLSYQWLDPRVQAIDLAVVLEGINKQVQLKKSEPVYENFCGY